MVNSLTAQRINNIPATSLPVVAPSSSGGVNLGNILLILLVVGFLFLLLAGFAYIIYKVFFPNSDSDPIKRSFKLLKKDCKKFASRFKNKRLWTSYPEFAYKGKILGECMTKEGELAILFRPKMKWWWIFGETFAWLDILGIAQELEIVKVEIGNIRNGIIESDADVVIRSAGISKIGVFYFPLFVENSSGKINDRTVHHTKKEKTNARMMMSLDNIVTEEEIGKAIMKPHQEMDNRIKQQQDAEKKAKESVVAGNPKQEVVQ